MSDSVSLALESWQPRLPDHYRVREVLGHGGGAIVLLADSEFFPQPVAIKIAHHPAWRETLEREAEILAGHNHPSIVRLLDYDLNGGDPFLVLEHVSGMTLTSYITNRYVSVMEAIKLLIEVTEGVAVLHLCGVVHGDLKPLNVLVTPEGRAKLIDFGVAWKYSKQRSAPFPISGSPSYMSPESFVAGTEQGPARDVYALGIMLWEICTGHTPFSTENIGEVFHHHTWTPVPLLADAAPPGLVYPTQLQWLLDRALAKNPRERIGHANVFLQELLLTLPHLGVTAYRRTRFVPGSYASKLAAEVPTDVRTVFQGPRISPD